MLGRVSLCRRALGAAYAVAVCMCACSVLSDLEGFTGGVVRMPDASIANDAPSAGAGGTDARDSTTDDSASTDAASCGSNLDCACGKVCGQSGTCVEWDCQGALCPQGAECACAGGWFTIKNAILAVRASRVEENGKPFELRNYRFQNPAGGTQIPLQITRCDGSSQWMFSSVTVSCVEITSQAVNATVLRFDGCVDFPATPLTLQDIRIAQARGPTIFRDANFSTLTLRRFADGGSPLQIGPKVDRLVFDESSDMTLNLAEVAIAEVYRSTGLQGIQVAGRVIYHGASCPSVLQSNESCM